MRAIVTRPGSGSAWLVDVPDPEIQEPDEVLVEMLRVGVCGTDRHVIHSPLRAARALPASGDYLVLGHEAIGRVMRVGESVESLREGDLVVPTVRRGCGLCPLCAAAQADLCSSGMYVERGIVGAHGFLSERIADRAENLVKVPAKFAAVGPLVESLCTPEKAIRRITSARAHLPLEGPLYGVARSLVTGSGPIALLAMLAFRLRGIETWLVARQPAGGPASEFAERSGAFYVALGDVDPEQPRARLGSFDAIVEATGAVELSVAMLGALAPNGVLDLVGGPPERKAVPIHANLLGAMVGRNLTVLGSVNANTGDWRAAIADLGAMLTRFPGVVEAMITHEFSMDNADVAFERVPGQIKAIIDLRR
jgi:threonine dehydrogenase-like Zn-dependent dehydrogenase